MGNSYTSEPITPVTPPVTPRAPSDPVAQLLRNLGSSGLEATEVGKYLTPVTDSTTLEWINKYIQNSNHHNNYKMAVGSAFSIENPIDINRFKKGKNHKLLWHGTSSENVVKILKSGFQLGTNSNSMFGPGIYFADCSSKSANYTHMQHNLAVNSLSTPLLGYMFLCEVVLGQSYDRFESERNAKDLCVSNGRHSIRGKGRQQPEFAVQYFLEGVEPMVHVPLGKLKRLGRQSQLEYNEYIIYNEQQVRMRYLVKVNLLPPDQPQH